MFIYPHNVFKAVCPLPISLMAIIERVFISNPLFPLGLHPSIVLSIFLLLQNYFVQSHSEQYNSNKCASPCFASILCTKLSFEEQSGELPIVSIISLKTFVSTNK